MNIPSIIIAIIVAAVFTASLVYLIISKKKGRNSCSCGCSGCSLHCNSGKHDKTEK